MTALIKTESRLFFYEFHVIFANIKITYNYKLLPNINKINAKLLSTRKCFRKLIVKIKLVDCLDGDKNTFFMLLK